MKRYQEIEIELKTKNGVINRLKNKFPELYNVWGEMIEYNFENNIDVFDDKEGCGVVLHTIKDDGYYYFCFIAFCKNQIVDRRVNNENIIL